MVPRCPVHLREMIPARTITKLIGRDRRKVELITRHYRCSITGCICVATVEPEPLKPKDPYERYPKTVKWNPNPVRP
jgi:hypothetical protein